MGTYMNFQTREPTQEQTSTNLKDGFKESKQSSGKTISGHHNQLRTEIEGQNRKKNKRSDVTSLINMDIQKRIVSPPAGIVIFLDIAIGIVLKEKIGEEAKAEEEKEEEMTLLLDKEDSHLKEENIPLIQKEKERKREAKTVGLEMTVLANQDQTQTDPADPSQDLDQKQSQTLLQEERNRREVEDQTETEEDTTRVTIIKMIELLQLTKIVGLAAKPILHLLSMSNFSEKLEMAVGDTGCTTSCIPLKMAKQHSLKIEKVDTDEPMMKSYQGENMKIVGQTRCFLQIQHNKGFTSKKLLHALVIEKAYDQEILISWDNCILMGIIPENFPYCNMEHDVDPQSEEDQNVEEKESA